MNPHTVFFDPKSATAFAALNLHGGALTPNPGVNP